MIDSNFYKVIKIISEYQIVINAGAEAGLKLNDSIEIFVPGEPVIDPDSKEKLGTLDFVKSRVIIDTLLPKMSICVNSTKTTTTPFTASIAIPNIFQATTSLKKLDVNPIDISGGYSNTDRQIRIGDLARLAP